MTKSTTDTSMESGTSRVRFNEGEIGSGRTRPRCGSQHETAEAGRCSPRVGGSGSSRWRVERCSPPSYHADEEQDRVQQRWTRVSSKRKDTLANLERRTLVIWGVPHDVPAFMVPRQLLGPHKEFESCEWRSTGSNRHLALVLKNILAMDALKDNTIEAGKRLGWRVVPGRE